jgi:sterol desaturase/sphingolipid hydroxylase (fatty acid hydroxylase superfamily)
MFAWMGVQILRNAMGHAGVELMPRWWLSSRLTRWISTTTHHNLHHAGSFNHNYGFYFTWWDRLMGTEHPDYASLN